ncbi:hypothetical protein SAMN04488126_102214 [Bhargavaea beijingensis]|uniref:Knr4/Smi1-like domain-containing protein n=1 Tax=Bhargavaea beijingensis TaxID=426756 RepID=A0A1G6Z668_9BACL|nr:hypothetical protein SAMN04488126_102214 [Bhargavaea beijingensis]
MDDIEKTLGIRLPETFRDICVFYSSGFLGGISHFAIPGDCEPYIKGETLRLRGSIGLPSRFIVLAEPLESLIVLDTAETQCGELGRLSARFPADARERYGAFFEELLAEEEKERRQRDMASALSPVLSASKSGVSASKMTLSASKSSKGGLPPERKPSSGRSARQVWRFFHSLGFTALISRNTCSAAVSIFRRAISGRIASSREIGSWRIEK